MGTLGSMINYWAPAWLILNSHCQKSASSSAVNSHQTYFRRTFLSQLLHPIHETSSFLLFLLHLYILNIHLLSHRLSVVLQLLLLKRWNFRLKHYKNNNIPVTPLRQLILNFGWSNVFILVYRRIKQTHSYL